MVPTTSHLSSGLALDSHRGRLSLELGFFVHVRVGLNAVGTSPKFGNVPNFGSFTGGVISKKWKTNGSAVPTSKICFSKFLTCINHWLTSCKSAELASR